MADLNKRKPLYLHGRGERLLYLAGCGGLFNLQQPQNQITNVYTFEVDEEEGKHMNLMIGLQYHSNYASGRRFVISPPGRTGDSNFTPM